MPVSPRAPSLVLLLLSFACQGQVGGSTASATETTAASSSSSSSTGATMKTTGTSGPTTTEAASETAATTNADGCDGYAAGDWNSCPLNSAACGWEEGSGAGMVLCLSPASGNFNVCGIRDCVDVCDCFAPPATGTAVPVCAPILGSGANGCALFCAGGQICPDGMTCHSGYCYWPD